MAMSNTERYRKDPDFRAKVNARNRKAYHENMKDAAFVKLQRTKARIHNARVSIAHHEERLEFFRKRLEADLKLHLKLTGKLPGVSGLD